MIPMEFITTSLKDFSNFNPAGSRHCKKESLKVLTHKQPTINEIATYIQLLLLQIMYAMAVKHGFFGFE